MERGRHRCPAPPGEWLFQCASCAVFVRARLDSLTLNPPTTASTADKQAAEKIIYFVIPSPRTERSRRAEARNLSLIYMQERRDSSARSPPRNDKKLSSSATSKSRCKFVFTFWRLVVIVSQRSRGFNWPTSQMSHVLSPAPLTLFGRFSRRGRFRQEFPFRGVVMRSTSERIVGNPPEDARK